jgi:uncharacterized LabA/DUF88 family protein
MSDEEEGYEGDELLRAEFERAEAASEADYEPVVFDFESMSDEELRDFIEGLKELKKAGVATGEDLESARAELKRRLKVKKVRA